MMRLIASSLLLLLLSASAADAAFVWAPHPAFLVGHHRLIQAQEALFMATRAEDPNEGDEDVAFFFVNDDDNNKESEDKKKKMSLDDIKMMVTDKIKMPDTKQLDKLLKDIQMPNIEMPNLQNFKMPEQIQMPDLSKFQMPDLSKLETQFQDAKAQAETLWDEQGVPLVQKVQEMVDQEEVQTMWTKVLQFAQTTFDKGLTLVGDTLKEWKAEKEEQQKAQAVQEDHEEESTWDE